MVRKIRVGLVGLGSLAQRVESVAVNSLESALRIYEELQSPWGIVSCLLALLDRDLKSGEPLRARRHRRRLSDLFSQYNLPFHEPLLLNVGTKGFQLRVNLP